MDGRGRTALITGAASGIGRATAERFAAEGYDLCLNDRAGERLAAVAGGLPRAESHLLCAGDYSLAGTAAAIDAAVRTRWGPRLDVLVNCAGVSRSVDAIDTPIDEWRLLLDVMTTGAVRMSRLAAGLMTAGGRIVHVSSIHGVRAERGASSYGMAKAAIEQLCRALAVELADRRILVNAIAPGFVDTPMSVKDDGTNELDTDWFRAHYVDGHHLPLRRAARPEEIAGVALFLAGPDASYITGQTIVVDGGLTITF